MVSAVGQLLCSLHVPYLDTVFQLRANGGHWPLFQCHHLVTEEASQEMTEMFAEETLNLATGGPISTRHLRQQAELNYQRRAEQAMADDNCFKFVFVSSRLQSAMRSPVCFCE